MSRKERQIKERMLMRLGAAVITVVFMALLRPEKNPSMFVSAVFTMMFYGINYLGIYDIVEDHREEGRKKREEQMRKDARRLAEERFVA